MIPKKVKGYVCFESGLNCVRVVWKFHGLKIWSKDFGPAYPDAIEAAEKFAGSHNAPGQPRLADTTKDNDHV